MILRRNSKSKQTKYVSGWEQKKFKFTMSKIVWTTENTKKQFLFVLLNYSWLPSY